MDIEPEPILRRVEEALHLIKVNDRLRYDRLLRDLERVWVRMVPGGLGRFTESLHACELDRRFVLAETSSADLIAATIVHEAAHARLLRCGIAYEEELRPRVEAVCLRRELAFAAKLPNGEQVRELAERTLALCTSQDHWADAAFDERNVAELRNLGTPEWLVRILLGLRALRLRVRSFAQSMARSLRRP